MLKRPLPVRPGIKRNPVHKSNIPLQISDLVDTFYLEVRRDDRLGPIFEAHISDWDRHLTLMKGLRVTSTASELEYNGKPVPAHLSIHEIKSNDFHLWLKLFRRIAKRSFCAEAVPLVIQKAELIAKSLWLAKFAPPFTNTPENL